MHKKIKTYIDDLPTNKVNFHKLILFLLILMLDSCLFQSCQIIIMKFKLSRFNILYLSKKNSVSMCCVRAFAFTNFAPKS